MDDIKRIDLVDIDLNSGNLHRSWVKHSIGKSDIKANAFGVRVYRDGEPVNLAGGSIQGHFLDSQGNRIAITDGSFQYKSGNVAHITLPQACYNNEGQFTLAIKLINSSLGITGTVRIVDGMVDNTNTGGEVAPTGSVPTYEQFLDVYEGMVAMIEEAETFMDGAVAPQYDGTKTYNVGEYVIHNGKLWRSKIDDNDNEPPASASNNYWTACPNGVAGQLKAVIGEIAPEYDPDGGIYELGDYVSYDRKFYRCKVALTDDPPTTAASWQQVDIANDLAAKIAAETDARENEDSALKRAISDSDNNIIRSEDLKDALSVVVGEENELWQTLARYDSGAWQNPTQYFQVGHRYKIVLTPNDTFTASVITVGTTPYSGGVIDTLGENVSLTSGVEKVYDYTPSAANANYVRCPSNAAKFSSIVVYEAVPASKAVLFTEAMGLTDSEKETGRENIGAASQAELDSSVKDIMGILFNTDGKRKEKQTGQTIILTGKNISNMDIPLEGQTVTVYKRNRFDNNGATYTYSGYSASHTLRKENNGISVLCNVTQTGAYLYTYTSYTAEFSGKLFFSCEADCTGHIEDLCVLLKVNDTTQTRLYGKGLLYESVTVEAGDTVQILFYTHMGTDAANTVKYKNIMLAYGGLYDFEKYGIRNEYRLPTKEADYTRRDSSASGKYYFTLPSSAHGLPSSIYPADNNTAANCEIEGLPLVTYNQTYNATNGVGVASTGAVSIFYNGITTKQDMMNFIAERDISIVYYSGASFALDGSRYNFEEGEIIHFGTAPKTVSYYVDIEPERKDIICFGDSITGMFGNDSGYPEMLTLLHNCRGINAGFSGTQYTDHTNANYKPFSLNRLIEAIVAEDFSMQDASPLVDETSENYLPWYKEHLDNIKNCVWTDIEYVTMFYGTNDWGSNVILKSQDDPASTNKQRTNVEDAIIYSIGQLVSKYPWLKVAVITPYWRAISAGKDSNVDPNSNGQYLFDYAEYIGETAQEKFNVPVIYLYRSLGANIITNRYFTQDGTHPTEMTKQIIAKRISAVLEQY